MKLSVTYLCGGGNFRAYLNEYIMDKKMLNSSYSYNFIPDRTDIAEWNKQDSMTGEESALRKNWQGQVSIVDIGRINLCISPVYPSHTNLRKTANLNCFTAKWHRIDFLK
jgi:hypothetical protein